MCTARRKEGGEGGGGGVAQGISLHGCGKGEGKGAGNATVRRAVEAFIPPPLPQSPPPGESAVTREIGIPPPPQGGGQRIRPATYKRSFLPAFPPASSSAQPDRRLLSAPAGSALGMQPPAPPLAAPPAASLQPLRALPAPPFLVPGSFSDEGHAQPWWRESQPGSELSSAF